MVGGEVQGGEHVPVILDFGTFGNGEAQAPENLDDFIAHQRQRMARSQGKGRGRAAQVKAVVEGLCALGGGPESVDFPGGHFLESVDFHADGFLLVGGNAAEIRHQGVDGAFFREIFDSQGFHFFRRGGLESGNLSLEGVYSV